MSTTPNSRNHVDRNGSRRNARFYQDLELSDLKTSIIDSIKPLDKPYGAGRHKS